MKEDLDIIPGHEIDYNSDYITKTKYKDEDFWIVDDIDGLEEYLNMNDRSDVERLLDTLFHYNWGYRGEWETCMNCGNAFYTQDNFTHDYWVSSEGGIYCGDCIKNNEIIQSSYVDSLINNSNKCNTFLSDSQLEELGLEKVGDYKWGYFGTNINPKPVLDKLLTKYPNGKFIFSLNENKVYSISYGVWAFPGYTEGEIKDEE